MTNPRMQSCAWGLMSGFGFGGLSFEGGGVRGWRVIWGSNLGACEFSRRECAAVRSKVLHVVAFSGRLGVLVSLPPEPAHFWL